MGDMLTNNSRIEIVQQIRSFIQDRYLDEAIAFKLASRLDTWLEDEAAEIPREPDQFAPVLTQLLFSISRDQHLRLTYRPQSKSDSDTDMFQQHFQLMQGLNYGFFRTERLIGNIGLLEMRELPPVEVAGELLHAAMTFLKHMHAFIIDLRLAKGGVPDMVQLLISYLVGEEPQPLSGVEWPRQGEQAELWTLETVEGQRFAHQPIYVLTSGMTHSAAEAVAYDLKALNRAMIIGEKTRGGAHLTSIIPLDHGLILHLPEGRAINPITKGNWEKTGISPDKVVPHQHALTTAHDIALHDLLEHATIDDEKRYFTWELESLMATLDPVSVSPRLMAGYGGTYGDWQIAIGDGGLYARHHTTTKLTPISDTEFILGPSTRLHFVTDESEDVVMMQVFERDGTLTSVLRTG